MYISRSNCLFFIVLVAGIIGSGAAQSQYTPTPAADPLKPKSEMLIGRPRSVSSVTTASLPRKISYQGLLTTVGGAPVADGSYDLTVSMYDSLTNGAVQWSEIHAGVPVMRGTFSISLGESSPLTLAFDKPMFVQVAATAGPAGPSYPLSFAPRSELTSAPYSLAPWVTNGTDIYYKHGNIGIGSSAPESSKIGTIKLDIADEDGNNSDVAIRVAGGGGSGGGFPLLNFAKSHGSLAAPTLLSAGNALGQVNFLGFDGTSYQGGAAIYTWVDSTPALGAIPAAMSFYTWNQTRGWNEKMRLDRNGSLSIDGGYMNNGALTPGLVLGGAGSGEGLSSKRTGGGNQYGIDFYTAYAPRMSINNYGYVGIGTTLPTYRLEVKDSTYNPTAHILNSYAGSAYGLYVDLENATAIENSYRTGVYSIAYYGRKSNDAGYFYAYGLDTSTNYGGVFYGFGGSLAYGVYASGGNYAGYFSGNLAYTGALINASDEKFKEGVQDYTGALERIMKVRPRTYTYKTGKELDRYNFSAGQHFGFVAQELEEVFPELVTTVTQPADRDDKGNLTNAAAEYKGIKTMEMIPILLQAIQEQQKRIDELQAKVDRLENK